ncbi:hypothetical protein FEFB_13000 [Fructobacillus sp. EFB-N1]|nr:hypothetical protein FEFB_13000 [Fructobacillus sp. EFB-N1]
MKKVVTIVVIFLVLVSGTFLVLRTSSSQSGHYVGKKSMHLQEMVEHYKIAIL